MEPAFYPSVERVRRDVPPGSGVALVMSAERDVDRGAFVTYYLYPRRVRYYWSVWGIVLDPEREKFPTILMLDLNRGEAVRAVKPENLRVEALGRGPLMISAKSMTVGRDLIVPVVASLDGYPPDTYRTEAVISGNDVAVTLEPEHVTKRVSGELRTSDIVGDFFQSSGTHWLRISAQTNATAAFWLVNRGRHVGTGIRLFDHVPLLPRTLTAGDTMWLVNTNDHVASVSFSQKIVTLQPRQITSFPMTDPTVTGPSGIIAFSSRKLPDGNTEFGW